MKLVNISGAIYKLTNDQHRDLEIEYKKLMTAGEMEENAITLDLSKYIDKNLTSYRFVGYIDLTVNW